jgi:hypothetical protein
MILYWTEEEDSMSETEERLPKDEPCACLCHDLVSVLHCLPCCAYTGIERGKAIQQAAISQKEKSSLALKPKA